MAHTTEQCRAMLAEAKQQKKTLMVAQNWRYTSWNVHVKNIIDRGELGKIEMVRSDWVLNFHDFYPKGHWIYDGHLSGGGAVIGLVVHNLDFLRFVFGEVKRVYAQNKYTCDRSLHDAENISMIQFEFASGTLGQMMTSTTPFVNEDAGPLQVYGDRGALFVDNKGNMKIVTSQTTSAVLAHERQLEDVAIPDYGNFTLNQMNHFLSCIQSGEQPISSGEDNIRTIQWVEAIYASARTGMPVVM
jgi:predicted dehydrogenase